MAQYVSETKLANKDRVVVITDEPEGSKEVLGLLDKFRFERGVDYVFFSSFDSQVISWLKKGVPQLVLIPQGNDINAAISAEHIKQENPDAIVMSLTKAPLEFGIKGTALDWNIVVANGNEWVLFEIIAKFLFCADRKALLQSLQTFP